MNLLEATGLLLFTLLDTIYLINMFLFSDIHTLCRNLKSYESGVVLSDFSSRVTLPFIKSYPFILAKLLFIKLTRLSFTMYLHELFIQRC